ncbi:MAG: hypothetical protein WB555_25960, partial [Candidatus Korobacteraceae bacterium]
PGVFLYERSNRRARASPPPPDQPPVAGSVCLAAADGDKLVTVSFAFPSRVPVDWSGNLAGTDTDGLSGTTGRRKQTIRLQVTVGRILGRARGEIAR